MPATISAIPDTDIPFSTFVLQAAGLWRRLRGEPCAPQPAYLAAAKAGEPDALAQLYDEYQPVLWRLCRRMLRREADAEDAMQSAFVKAFAALPRFRGDANLKTWLYRIALNEATNLLRRRDTVAEGEDVASDLLPMAAIGMSETERFAVRSLLPILKPDHRTVLMLRYWEDLSYEEISEILSLPLPSVKMRIHRAKEAFRQLYVISDEPNSGRRQ